VILVKANPRGFTCSMLDMVCSIADRCTGLSLYDNFMSVRLRAGNARAMRLSIRQHLYLYQSDSTSLRDNVLQAVQPEVCTTGMLASVNQALQLVWDTSKQILH
jgi:hypothetical protein